MTFLFFAFADGREIIWSVFAASKLDRLSTVSPGVVDVGALAATVSTLTVQVDALTKRVDCGLNCVSQSFRTFEQEIECSGSVQISHH